jgi:nicotinamide-nucleotide amidase
MRIGLLIIGNEILQGKISDSNTTLLARYLIAHNRELSSTMVVGDEIKSIHQGLNVLFSSCDVVITSGGLGPTQDDVTKEALASWFKSNISYSQEAFEVASKNYQRFNRPVPSQDHPYCYLPQGFIALENSTGFAPGLFMQSEGKYLLSGPGVPREFKSLLEDHFASLILSQLPKSEELIELYTVRTKRIPEEKIFKVVDPTLWEKLAAFGSVSSLPHIMGVDIGVTLKAQSSREMENKKSQLKKIFLHSPLAGHIWHFGVTSLEELIVRVANEKKITYGFAESCTGGLCSHRITSVSGCSQTFLGSVVSYAESVKSSILGVSEQTLAKFSAVSEQAASEMAQGVAQKLKLDIGISITGLAGPGGGSSLTPVGTVYIGVWARGKSSVYHYHFPGEREQLKQRFSQGALYLLLEELQREN